MPNVRQSFDAFLQCLELSKSEVDAASRQHTYLRTELGKRLQGVDSDVLVGSYKRGTAIRPLDDIDVFLVLNHRAHGKYLGCAPQLILEVVLRAVREIYEPSKPASRIQTRSVNVSFTGTGIGYDIIPAFAPVDALPNPSDPLDLVYQIPDRGRQGWIPTNPRRHHDRLVKANEVTGGRLNRIIKAAKFWNRSKASGDGSKPLRSFHIEAMAYGAFNGRPASERHGFADLLGYMAHRVTYTCPDPAKLGPDVDGDLTDRDRQRLRELISAALADASLAIQHETVGEDGKAIAAWQRIFGTKAIS